MRIHFNDAAIMMFEYPSEASLLESDSPDMPNTSEYNQPSVSSPEEEQTAQLTSNRIKNAPNVTAAG